MLNWDVDQCAFIHQASAEQVYKALVELCAAEGMLLTADQVQPKHVAPAATVDEWKFQILSGTGDWTLVRCSPRYALVEKSTPSTSPRFLTLCQSLSAFGFMLMATNYQRQAGWVLLEVEKTGRLFLSGYWLDNLETSDGKDFFGYSLDTDDSPWKITPRSSTLLKLLSDANSPNIQATLDGSTTRDGITAYKDVMTQAELEMKFRRTVEMPGGCFVAGTSAHTKDGLKPIEQIQVGDWVLSRHESGEGEPAYKQVTRTFSFEDKEVWTLEVCKREDVELRGSTEGLVSRIVATPNHPFWVIGKGWTALYHMAVGDNLITSDGKLVEIGHIEPLYKSRLSADLAFDLWTKNYSDIDGWLLNFSSGIDFQTDVPTKKLISGGGHFDLGLDYNSPESFYRTKIYNLEVDDFHTYCVGPLGVWVHNTNCEDVGGIGRAISQGLVPSNGAGFYQTIAEANAFTGTKKGLILVAENPRPGSLGMVCTTPAETVADAQFFR